MRADLLHVIAVVNNPLRWRSRIELYTKFAQHMRDSGVVFWPIECAYGDIPHVIPDAHQVWAKTQLWIKENLINLAIARLPRDWKYVAWIDADIMFRRPDWAKETVYQLQFHDIVQPWSDCYDLGPNGEHLEHHRAFCWMWQNRRKEVGCPSGPGYTFCHPGYAWAATRNALEGVGGLLEIAALGAGDHHMALALTGLAKSSLPGGISDGYRRHVMQWQQRAEQHIVRNIGYVQGTIEHQWHGPKFARRYISRWDILTKNGFDPDIDLKKNTAGVLELVGNKPELKREIMAYFASRNEDANS